MSKQISKFITVKEAAKELETSNETIRRYVKSGLLPALVMKTGKNRNTIRILKEEFKKNLSACEVRPDRMVRTTKTD